MEKAKKFTKKENFGAIIEVLKVAKIDKETRERLVKAMENELALVSKKGSKKVNEQNELIKKMIIDALTNATTNMTITNILELDNFKSFIVSTDKETNEIKKLSNQKISALMTQLIDEKKVERVTDKKKTYFKLLEVA